MTPGPGGSVRTTFPSIALTIGEWTVATRMLGVTVTAPGAFPAPSRRALDEAAASMASRRAVAGNSLNADLAAMIFSLAHPRTACWVHRHGSTVPHAFVASNARVSALAWAEEDRVRVAPTTNRHIGADLAALAGMEAGATPSARDTFSVAGGLWHDLVTQAPAASHRALVSLAAAEGVAPERTALLASLAAANQGRVDLRAVRRNGSRTWSGNEMSLLHSDAGVWTVADGRGFDDTGSRASSRAVFTLADPRELMAAFVTS